MPSPSIYQTENGQVYDGIDDIGIQELFRQPSWLYKRNSPLCDYRLQSRPLPLTSALCGYGHNNKEGSAPQLNLFKYG